MTSAAAALKLLEKAVDNLIDGDVFGPGGEGERHAVPQHRLRERDHIVD